jgi:hypothetical protein
MPKAVGWVLHRTALEVFSMALLADAAALLTRTLRGVPGTPSTGCCGAREGDGSCFPCQGPDTSVWLTPHGREELGGSPFGDGTPPGPPPEGEGIPDHHGPGGIPHR